MINDQLIVLLLIFGPLIVGLALFLVVCTIRMFVGLISSMAKRWRRMRGKPLIGQRIEPVP